MKKVVVVLLSLGVLAGAYVIAFGVPHQVSQLWGSVPTEESGAPSRGVDAGPRGQSRTTTVVLAPLEERSYSLSLRAVGSAVSSRRADVIATETGEVAEAALQANTLVEQGDVILRLDDRTERLSLEIAQANRDQAQATVSRYEGLHNNGSSVVTDVALAEAEVALRLAEANVGLAEVALENRTITAPISGRIGLSDIHVGDQLSSGDLIVTIDDSTTLLAEFEVPERSIGLLAEGKPVFVVTPTYTGRVFEGAITAFDSRLDSVTRSATVQAEIDNAEGLLLSGMTFAVRMTEETTPLPIVPSTAITWDRAGAGIWVAVEGTTSRVPVTIRYRDGDQVWIETEARVGSQIVTEGASKLREGAQVSTAQSNEGQGV
ncbi:efflux RND transporter periplasmic adaptor subunit [Yoonia sp. I 8.24]|uniref:efflux RND transporter periplasmic adaptor subunit n=1 Tax=Yoonia sp. I 8.24 TaxID=1537229 RepID=UPI001EDCE268|nr:efflux RND transporter periplasmic adaptor subunit [Yoonia sp. I 8.24]MCG3268207.1 efflux RND transporter periplasmic adaptor subunit [Yoonia sp. I 8.24]